MGYHRFQMLLFWCTLMVITRVIRADPNFVLIITDDQDLLLNGMVPMKNTLELVANHGKTFQNAFANSPICCPSRSTILTGKFPHNTGVVNNSIEGNCSSRIWQEHYEPRSVAAILQENKDYVTFYAGKYLNTEAYPTVFSHLKHKGQFDSTEEPFKKLVILEGNTTSRSKEVAVEQSEGLNMEKSSQRQVISDVPIATSELHDAHNLVSVPSTSNPCTPGLSSCMSTQTTAHLSTSSPRKKKLRRQIQCLKLKINKQKTTVEKKSEKEKYSLSDFNKMCDIFLNKQLAQIVKTQAVLKNSKKKGRRYSNEYKQFAVSLNFLGPRAYGFMEKILYLPSKRSLQKMTEQLSCKPGLNNTQIYEALQVKVKTMLDEDKHCSICIDEMSLKSNLYFDTGRDEIVGLCDIGNDKKEALVAQNALVIMARGLYSNWKQPLAYFFVHTTFDSDKLVYVIKECITKLFETGLYVQCLVSDTGSNFVKLSRLLGVKSGKSEFYVDDNKVVFIFDPCHLVKATRNALINNVFCFDGYKKTSWSFVETFYHEDNKNFYKCAPKLTYPHIYPSSFEKMRVKLATQVLSNTVASAMSTYIALGILPSEAAGTIEIIEKFNNLFDVLNSTERNNSNPFKNVFEGTDFQLNFLNSMMTFIKNIKIFDKTGKDVTSRFTSMKCWIVTINGVKQIWDNLSSKNFKYLKTRRLNQDCVENYFGSVRQQGGNSVNPTPIQFQRAFKKLFAQNFLHSSAMNCTDDFDIQLMNLKPNKVICTNQQPITNSTKAISLSHCDYKNESLVTQNAFQYVCGYLIKKALGIHICQICKDFSKTVDELDFSLLLIHFKVYNTEQFVFGGLRTPSKDFVQYIYKLEKLFCVSFENKFTHPLVSNSYLNEMKFVKFSHPCKSFPQLYVLKLFIRLRLFYTLKYFNRDLKSTSNKKKNKKNRKLTILSHI